MAPASARYEFSPSRGPFSYGATPGKSPIRVFALQGHQLVSGSRRHAGAPQPPPLPSRPPTFAVAAGGGALRSQGLGQAGGLGLQRELEDLADRHHGVEAHRLAHVFGDVLEVAAIALGNDHVG